ncbi:MAG: 2-hydroxyhepta-2,4-diene-1,7-dioate isomerase [Sediminibacterium sp.]|nr:MAG: 2-hydroxyhepta-2,4-diene-1,7-dioate isomerase [Sediminibacterium sp.]
MRLYNTTSGIYLEKQGLFYKTDTIQWDELVNTNNLYTYLQSLIFSANPINQEAFNQLTILPPIEQQEIWAAGVTYLRSREARMEESKISGGADFYAKVYDAQRPELFFKSTAARCVGTNATVNIRKDASWNVPEPELTLFANAHGEIVGYTIGNDMSSRDIEGENPLYLPQAKCYEKSAAIGPCLYVPEKPINPNATINMQIFRAEAELFSGQISINQMKRTHQELIDYLFRSMDFPNGVYLMTGTCLVPPNEFTLAVGDRISISIAEIGVLTNTVALK